MNFFFRLSSNLSQKTKVQRNQMGTVASSKISPHYYLTNQTLIKLFLNFVWTSTPSKFLFLFWSFYRVFATYNSQTSLKQKFSSFLISVLKHGQLGLLRNSISPDILSLLNNISWEVKCMNLLYYMRSLKVN